MRIAMVLFALAVCYVSLPVTLQVAAVGQSNDSKPAGDEPSPSESEKDEPKEKTESAEADEAPDAAEKKSAPTDEKKTKEKKPVEEKKKERKTAKVETKRLKVVVTLDGTFTAEKMTPVALRPEDWSQFEIVEIVDARLRGPRRPDARQIRHGEIRRRTRRSGAAAARQRAGDSQGRRGTAAAGKDRWRWPPTEAERNDKNVREDFDRFHKIDRPMLLKSVDYSLKSAQFQLDYEQDELDQLEKMYEADDLTEDTEEIVLKRSRTEVDFAKFNLEQTKQYCDELLQVRLPRFDIDIKESLDKAGSGAGASEDGTGARREPRPLRSRTASARRGPSRSIGTPSCSPIAR